MSNKNVWEELLEGARYAPSPHNTQPWRLQSASDRAATLYYDPRRLIPDTDPTGQFTTIGFGIFLEYMRVIASHQDLTLTWKSLQDNIDRTATNPMPFFSLRLETGAVPDELNPRLIRKRQTSRLPYKSEPPVAEQCLEEITETARAFGHSFVWSQKPEIVQWLLLLNRDTLFYDMDDDVARTEVSHWIRYSQKEAVQRRDGLAASCMQMPGWLMRLFFQNHQLLNTPFIKRVVQWNYLRSMSGTTTVAWIAGPTANHEQWILAGQMLGRIWLLMTQANVYLHPFGSIITNPIAHERLGERIKCSEGENPLWLVMRLGHSGVPPESKRRSSDEIAYAPTL